MDRRGSGNPPPRRFGGKQERRVAPPGSYILHISTVLGGGEQNILMMHSYGVHRRDGEHTLFKEGVKIFFRNPSPFNDPQR